MLRHIDNTTFDRPTARRRSQRTFGVCLAILTLAGIRASIANAETWKETPIEPPLAADFEAGWSPTTDSIRSRPRLQPVSLVGIEPFAGETSDSEWAEPITIGWSPPPVAETKGAVCDVCCPEHCSGCPPCVRYTFKNDWDNWLPGLKDDTHALVNWHNGLLLGAALGGAIIMRQDLDKRVRDGVASHPQRWGDGTRVLGRFGDVQYQIPFILGIYAWSLKTQDDELHSFSTSLVNAFTITGVSTLGVKLIANTDRPSSEWNDGSYGFPSYHTASSFTIAAVIDEYYGPRAGLPAYALAGLIGWSRIDDQDHDLSDVFFGAALGYVIGKSVAGYHLRGDSRVRLFPYVHPTEGSTGLLVEIPY